MKLFKKQTLRIHNLNDANVEIRTFYYFLNWKLFTTRKMEYNAEIQEPLPEFPILSKHYDLKSCDYGSTGTI
ncbi:hypothetical protein ACF3N7_05220 [Cruoricaptor ignavus]|uniref:hypothetical protein n=1 Tax=Cruoricaptor ignavus TaxID=1118202 RepID=UPI00370D6C6D